MGYFQKRILKQAKKLLESEGYKRKRDDDIKALVMVDLKKYETDLIERQKTAKHKVSPAFILDGVQYYQFDDVSNMPAGRIFASRDYLAELSTKVNREYLEEETKAIDIITQDLRKAFTAKSGALDLTTPMKAVIDLELIAQQRKERLEMIIDPEIVYKIASVVYFDNSESLNDYDFKYGQEKMKKWKEHNLDGFFLIEPIKAFIPSLDMSQSDFAQYMEIGEKISKSHLDALGTMLSQRNQKTEKNAPST